MGEEKKSDFRKKIDELKERPHISKTGGYLSDYEGEIIRVSSKWPLTVSISVTKFYGVGVHYYVTVRVDYDAILRVDEDGEIFEWTPWDIENDDKYVSLKQNFSSFGLKKHNTASSASREINKIKTLAKDLGLEVDTSGNVLEKWFYKEGD